MNNISAEQIVVYFFVICGVVVVLCLAIMGLVFVVASFKRIKQPEDEDQEYIVYLKKGYVLRFCYGYCVAADVLLKVIEIAATATGTFIALIPNTPSALVATMLITTFIASAIQNALDLKHGRSAYAKAFRILEFATDDYRISFKGRFANEKLHEENKKSQQIIAELYE